MQFGRFKKSNKERIHESMMENQARDPAVSRKSLLGNDELVMDLRPTKKERHVGASPYFALKAKTRAEEMQDETLLYRKKHFGNDEEGLPPVNSQIGRLDRFIR